MKKIVYLPLCIVGLAVMAFLIWQNNNYSSKLIEVNSSSELDIEVRDAYNERGIYILNDSIYIGENEITKIDTSKFHIADLAIWRPKNSKFIPRISDINAPFHLQKLKNENTLNLIQGLDTITVKLK